MSAVLARRWWLIALRGATALLAAAATTSAAWGGIAALAPRWSTVAPPTLALWLVAYAWLFGALLLGLAACLQRHHRAAVFE